MDSKKIATYLSLFIGLVVLLITFFLTHGRGIAFTSEIRDTEFYHVFRRDFDIRNRDLIKFLWFIFLVGFAFCWWQLRNCITGILLKFHKGL